MAFTHMHSETAVPTPGFEIPPYHVESFLAASQDRGWHCVCNKLGFNCLSFTDKPGAKFTTLENATAICERWNMRSNANVTSAEACEASVLNDGLGGCICKGNWREIVKECEPLIGRKFREDRSGNEYVFFGPVHGEDDYYYGMSCDGYGVVLLSCVGAITGFGFTILPPNAEIGG